MVQVTLPSELLDHSLIMTQWKLCQACSAQHNAQKLPAMAWPMQGASILWSYILYNKHIYTSRNFLEVSSLTQDAPMFSGLKLCQYSSLPGEPVVDPYKQARSAPVSSTHVDTLVAQGFTVPSGNCQLFYCHKPVL